MSPVHVTPFVAVGVVLIEHVVIAAMENRAVGIVDPIGRRSDVEDRFAGICLGAGAGFFDAVCGLLQLGILDFGFWIVRTGRGGAEEAEKQSKVGSCFHISVPE